MFDACDGRRAPDVSHSPPLPATRMALVFGFYAYGAWRFVGTCWEAVTRCNLRRNLGVNLFFLSLY